MSEASSGPPEELIDRLVEQVVEAVHPLRIILFGSAARGEMRQSSDLDVLVVMPDGTAELTTAADLYQRVGWLGVPVDYVVATPWALERYGHLPGFVYREALREGRELYAAG